MKPIFYKTLKIPSILQISFSTRYLYLVLSSNILQHQCLHIPTFVRLEKKENNLLVYLLGNNEKNSTFINTWITLLQSALHGLTRGYTLNLNLRGIGFRAQLQNNALFLKLGHSHFDILPLRKTVDVFVSKNTSLLLKSVSKTELGHYGADIRVLRLPDAYKGKGVVYKGEVSKLKVGKKT